jgi:hypothetical protein
MPVACSERQKALPDARGSARLGSPKGGAPRVLHHRGNRRAPGIFAAARSQDYGINLLRLNLGVVSPVHDMDGVVDHLGRALLAFGQSGH